jgi:hypothetical protein
MNPVACNPSWATVLSALLTPTIAVVVAYVAWRQWRTAHEKLQLDLFDRRLAIHGAARGLIATITSSGKVRNEELFKFRSGIQQARWLLNEDIAQYFEHELWPRASELQALCSEGPGDTTKQRELKDWIQDQRENLDRKFDPFLKMAPPSPGVLFSIKRLMRIG